MIQVIVHRGLRSEMPGISLDAISLPLRLPGIYGVEFDVELPRDRLSVVLHQETLVPSSDYARLEAATREFVSRGWPCKTSAEAIGNMDAGSWMDRRFAHLRAAT